MCCVCHLAYLKATSNRWIGENEIDECLRWIRRDSLYFIVLKKKKKIMFLQCVECVMLWWPRAIACCAGCAPIIPHSKTFKSKAKPEHTHTHTWGTNRESMHIRENSEKTHVEDSKAYKILWHLMATIFMARMLMVRLSMRLVLERNGRVHQVRVSVAVAVVALVVVLSSRCLLCFFCVRVSFFTLLHFRCFASFRYLLHKLYGAAFRFWCQS